MKIYVLMMAWCVSGLCMPGYAQATDKKINKVVTTLGGQGYKTTEGGFLDLIEGKEYKLKDATSNQGSIDLIYVHGEGTGANFICPSFSGDKIYGKRYRQGVKKKWKTRNRGRLIAVENNKANRKAYREIKKESHLKAFCKEAVQTVKRRDNYDPLLGPGERIGRLQTGDYIAFQSLSRDIYAIGRIVNIEKGIGGSITVHWKIAG
ncbi:hypothetical protein [Sinomicrobium weinanense]|uniref:Uncharacterized protein n=1 Tax=Sinomicrobium weinanense TaxID=2842200 RepID=A0A926JQY5_9FLAO|nr:hypothetical protein [Sinomicrobium weinanense]MBC9795739.1 hypothetical protein [Sinomicrobium weinanense]MBU3125302.1 hypothetical protein [Sinomicrobium weinanense]